ncbi:MAG TPA: NAD(P)/FAD-dependent oxidoreductase [Acidimicrobiales bacterium]|nr:NAD(P)/FAD-dependent oxidoreductase [Acidimicrobiales bacterium]
MAEQAEVIVVGMGPGSEDVAEKLAVAGLDVIGIDAELVGGECPYWGCIPSKMMIRASNLLAEARRIPGMAGESTVRPDWGPVAARIRKEATDDWDDTVAVKRFEDKGGRFVRGWGRLDGPRRVVVGDRTFEASRAIVIGVGARFWAPPIPGLADTPYWTNRQAIEVETLPATLAILGGGPIGVELAQVFSRFGVEVTVLELADRLLAPEDPESSELLAKVFEREGIAVRTSVTIDGVRHDGRRFTVSLGSGEPVVAEQLLVAAGRRPDLQALNAASIGVADDARVMPVDDHMRVTEGVWAVGDVTGKGAFTHVSMYQAAIVIDDILGRPVTAADYRAVPRVTFTDPEIGSVGLGEAAARDQGINVQVGRAQIPDSARGWIHKAGNDGFIKLVADTDRGVLVGATSVGPVGGEVLSMLTLAVHARIPVRRLGQMIYAYPTFHRAIEPAVQALV